MFSLFRSDFWVVFSLCALFTLGFLNLGCKKILKISLKIDETLIKLQHSKVARQHGLGGSSPFGGAPASGAGPSSAGES